MNGKTAKLVSLYVGARKAAGRPVSLKDFKRRWRMLPWNRRWPIREAMMAYILEREPKGRRELRALRPHWGKVEKKRGSGLLGWFSALLGFAR